MRTLETERLIIRAFVLEDADTVSRLMDAAFGAGAHGSADEKRVMFEYAVAADAGHGPAELSFRQLKPDFAFQPLELPGNVVVKHGVGMNR